MEPPADKLYWIRLRAMGEYGPVAVTKVRRRDQVCSTIMDMVAEFTRDAERGGSNASVWRAMNVEVTGLEPHEVEMFEAMKEHSK